VTLVAWEDTEWRIRSYDLAALLMATQYPCHCWHANIDNTNHSDDGAGTKESLLSPYPIPPRLGDNQPRRASSAFGLRG